MWNGCPSGGVSGPKEFDPGHARGIRCKNCGRSFQAHGRLLVGALVALIALILLIGGFWFVTLGGSAYYLLTVAAKIAAGFFLMRGRLLGGWIYGIIFFLTLTWALWEVGANGWALVPRVIAPLVLAFLRWQQSRSARGAGAWRWEAAPFSS
jgi:glucose dehydrogenase